MWENVSGGTTFTLIVMVGNLLYVAELGDSDAYLITPEPILSEADEPPKLQEPAEAPKEHAKLFEHTNVLYD